jgi:hypothetical protein
MAAPQARIGEFNNKRWQASDGMDLGLRTHHGISTTEGSFARKYAKADVSAIRTSRRPV